MPPSTKLAGDYLKTSKHPTRGVAGKPLIAAPPHPRRAPRASRLLRDLLRRNTGVESFTIERIVADLEHGPAASLMLFSIPAIAPMPGTEKLVGVPTLALAGGLLKGETSLSLPASLRARKVPRRSLVLAIHAILPILQRAERATKERWSWLCTPAARRAIGILVFLLALPLAVPFLGFSLPHAASLFTIALGMVEKDGVLVAIGVVAGIAALVFITGRHLAPEALATRAVQLATDLLRRVTCLGRGMVALLKQVWRRLAVRLLSGPSARTKKSSPSRPQPLRVAASSPLGLTVPAPKELVAVG